MTKKTTLIIEDQVNCKFTDLDPITRRKLVKELSVMVPYARHTPAFKLGRWDGTVSFCTLGGSTYINLLDKALPFVMNEGYEVDLDDRRPVHNLQFDQIDENYLANSTWPEGHPLAGEPIMLREHQVRAVNTYLQDLQCIQSISTGAGKAQPLWSKIKVPNGWKTMADIEINDVVTTPDGSTAKVVGVYAQGLKPVYRFTFKDGRTAEACEDHLWEVFCIEWKNRDKSPDGWRILTTKELIALKKSKKRPMRVRLPKCEDKPSADLPLDAYVLGALLGDGGISNEAVMLSSADQEILDKVSQRLIEGYELRHAYNYDYRVVMTKEKYKENRKEQGLNRNGKWQHYVNVLTEMNLMGKKSNSKFIPRMYIEEANLDQKLDLIRGLLDTDGYVGRHGDITLCTVSKQMALDFQELIRSIGGEAAISEKKTTYTHNGVKRSGQLAYNVRVRYAYPRQLLSLSRKKEKTSEIHMHGTELLSQIIDIDFLGEFDAQCIMIDHPDHLYITDNYVVTHNTIVTGVLSKIVEPYGRTICIVPNKSLVEQTEEDYRNLGLDVGVFFGDRKEWYHQHTICTWQSLAVFSKKSKRDEVDIPISEFLSGVVCVMVDETHTAQANELRDLLCGPMANIPIRWGLTGTIPTEPHQFWSILASLGPVVGEIKAKELQDKGILSNCHIHITQTIDNDVEFKDYHEAYKYLTSDEKRLEWLVKFCQNLPEGNKLILVDRIETGEMIAEAMQCDFVSGNVKNKDRKIKYKSFTDNTKIDLVATYGCAAVGINIPALHHLVLVEAGKSFVRVLQSIGRGLRKTKVKDYVDVYDICSTNKYSAKHLTERKKFYKEAEYPFQINKINYK